jgi:NADH-Ubiquinone oxidoreductase (complex I), chain 5 N-terminus
MYLSIIILPFLGSIVSGFLGRKIGIKGSQFISCLCLFLSAILSTFAFYEVGISNSPVSINLGNWIDSEILQVTWEFLFDQLSVVFCIMITYITFLILVYTVYYMEGQPLSVVGSRNNGVILSNSGDTLKIPVPSNSRKAISGWSNHSGMVTSCNMSENEMGNRGSKSELLVNFVKEQRIEGSRFITIIKYIIMNLRFILMGFERNYQVKILSKQLNINNYSTGSVFTVKSNDSIASVPPAPAFAGEGRGSGTIHPWFWTGLTDAEGSFKISMSKTEKRKLGWLIEPLASRLKWLYILGIMIY